MTCSKLSNGSFDSDDQHTLSNEPASVRDNVLFRNKQRDISPKDNVHMSNNIKASNCSIQYRENRVFEKLSKIIYFQINNMFQVVILRFDSVAHFCVKRYVKKQ